MNTEKQRIAIAKVCGWKPVRQHWEKDDESAYCNDSHCHRQLPNYPQDLNAMHEAEKTLSAFHRNLYADNLVELLRPYRTDDYSPNDDIGAPRLAWGGVFQVTHASAVQRAEAFLRTLNLWEE